MKSNKITFLLSEIILGLLLLLCVFLIFSDEKPQKRVAVIIEKSGDEKWDSFINGIKQAAREKNIHLIICNTDEIEDAQEEKSLITEQMDNQVDAFIIQAAPGFRVIIVTVANSLGNIRVFELLPKLKTKKYGWCIA